MHKFTIHVEDDIDDKSYKVLVTERREAWKLHHESNDTCPEDLEKLLWILNDVLELDLHGLLQRSSHRQTPGAP